MDTMRLSCESCGQRATPHQVGALRYWLKVVGVHAATDPAQVIQSDTSRDRSLEKFVCYAVGILSPTFPVWTV